mmetsp:Transcript_26521/g.57579  ORF Transcript_26521/g.57579 Transcript_26521/m.57579 type:complete len:247 (-) Transcript_26521:1474-2214(-)
MRLRRSTDREGLEGHREAGHSSRLSSQGGQRHPRRREVLLRPSPRGARSIPPKEDGHHAFREADRHLGRRVPGRDELLVLDLQWSGARHSPLRTPCPLQLGWPPSSFSSSHQDQGDPLLPHCRPRLRPLPHWQQRRVRLVLSLLRQDIARLGPRRHRHQLQSRDGLHGFRRVGSPLLRRIEPRDGLGHHRAREARRRHHLRRRPDPEQLGHGPAQEWMQDLGHTRRLHRHLRESIQVQQALRRPPH